MRALIRGFLALLIVGTALAQTPPVPSPTATSPQPPKQTEPEKKTGALEQLLTEAMKNNPDVRVAESKVREAEAELNRARMQVMQKVVALRGAIEGQQGAVKEAEAGLKFAEMKLARMLQLHKQNAVNASIVEEARATAEAARQKVVAAKARIADLEAELGFATGKHRAFWLIRLAPNQPGATRPVIREMEIEIFPDPMAVGSPERVYAQAIALTTAHQGFGDKLRTALDKHVKVDYKDKPLDELLKEFQSQHGINFVLATRKLGETKVTLQVEDMAFGAVLEMLEDMVPGVHFAVRDYGVLVTSAERLPPGAVPLYTFWKAAKQQKPAAETTPAKR